MTKKIELTCKQIFEACEDFERIEEWDYRYECYSEKEETFFEIPRKIFEITDMPEGGIAYRKDFIKEPLKLEVGKFYRDAFENKVYIFSYNLTAKGYCGAIVNYGTEHYLENGKHTQGCMDLVAEWKE